VVGQVDDGSVEAIRDRRAGWAASGVVGSEHEVVDEELRAPLEKVCQRGAPRFGLESIRLVNPNPRQFLPPLRQHVAAPRELLLRLEQLEPGGEPFFACSGYVLRHRSSHFRVVTSAASACPLELRTAVMLCVFKLIARNLTLRIIGPYKRAFYINSICCTVNLWHIIPGIEQRLLLAHSCSKVQLT
jgi:hypothetical protein